MAFIKDEKEGLRNTFSFLSHIKSRIPVANAVRVFIEKIDPEREQLQIVITAMKFIGGKPVVVSKSYMYEELLEDTLNEFVDEVNKKL